MPNISSNSDCVLTTVGTNAGPFWKGPITAAPISPIPCARKERSFSLVNTPGDTIFYAIFITPCYVFV